MFSCGICVACNLTDVDLRSSLLTMYFLVLLMSLCGVCSLFLPFFLHHRIFFFHLFYLPRDAPAHHITMYMLLGVLVRGQHKIVANNIQTKVCYE